VITDARGNVPLAASRAGHLERPVFRDGIDDALEAARALRTLNNLEIHFLNPQPQQYPELPAMLAEVLGANVEYIPRDESF
jgi:magnesium chelatase subunit D